MKIVLILSIVCIIFYACKKSNPGTQAAYPTVSYTLHTKFENRIYDLTHSSVYVRGSGLFDNWIYWDGHWDGLAIRGTYACEARNSGAFYKVNLYEKKVQVYDSATGYYSNTRSILVFTLPTVHSFTNQNDTSVLIDINGTSFKGHAINTMNIVSVNTDLAEPMPTITGSFSMTGIILDGSGADSLAFSSSGTFTNMPYR